MNNWANTNAVTLAYVGDAIYEVYVRTALVKRGMVLVNNLHREATRYVSAKAQAELIQKMIATNLLNEAELDIYKRGRNAKTHTKAKNTDVMTYHVATGFEAVFGYLHLSDQKDRLEELAIWCIQTIENEEQING